MLNPQYLIDIIPATSKQYALTLPIENISEYIEHEQEIHAKDSLYLKEYVIHANLEKKRLEKPNTITKWINVFKSACENDLQTDNYKPNKVNPQIKEVMKYFTYLQI